MGVPIAYSYRNLLRRRTTTLLTASGMALVVFVFAATLMLAEGLRQTLVATGSADNAILLRKGSEAEVQSAIDRDQARILATLPEIASGGDGAPLVAKEMVVLIGLPKRATGKISNVVIRGVGKSSLSMRPQVRIAEGRAPRPGASEIMAGSSVAKRFIGGGLNETVRFGQREWTVVGVFDAGNTGFASEIWGDVDQLMQAFRRNAYSLTLLRLRDSREFEALKARLETDPRLTVEVKRENRYYEDQSAMMAKFLRILGISLTAIFSLGAMLGAMITMYSAVAGRVAEIGTMRALGFARTSILLAFLAEALFLGALGGVLGLCGAACLNFFTFSTMNFQTFSELAFGFALTGEIALETMAFAVGMGVIGGFLPALRASRISILQAFGNG